MKSLYLAVALTTLTFAIGCDEVESLDNFDVVVEAEVVIERGTPVETLLGGFPALEGFTRIDLAESQDFSNTAYDVNDVDRVTLTSMVMTVVLPDAPEGDLSFLGEVIFYVEAPGLDRIEVARADDFPSDVREVAFATTDADLKHYLVGTEGTLTAEVNDARRPDVETTIGLTAVFDVDVDVL